MKKIILEEVGILKKNTLRELRREVGVTVVYRGDQIDLYINLEKKNKECILKKVKKICDIIL